MFKIVGADVAIKLLVYKLRFSAGYAWAIEAGLCVKALKNKL